MNIQILNDSELTGTIRNKINDNFNSIATEVNSYTKTLTALSAASLFLSGLKSTTDVVDENASSWASSYSSSLWFPISGGTLTSLTVEGSACLSKSSSSPVLNVQPTRVGINTENPTEALTVDGNATFIGKISLSSIRIGNSKSVIGITGQMTSAFLVYDLNDDLIGAIPIYNSIN